MHKAILLGGLIISATTITALQGASAHGGAARHLPEFSELDADGDNTLTREELQVFGASGFQDADLDGDGLLSGEELSAQAHARVDERVARMIERRDENGDGALSAGEIRPDDGRTARMFEIADANDDGGISRAEFEHAMLHFGERRGRHGRGRRH